MTVNVGTLFKKSILRDINGNIIDWRDETDGGWIIRNRQVINQEKIDEYAKKELDRTSAAQAESHAVQVAPEAAENRVVAPSKMKELEDKVVGMESKLDAILAKLK